MKWTDLRQIGYEKLRPLYGDIESNSIVRILFEDLVSKSSVLSNDQIAVFYDAIHRLLKSEPVQYITGVTYFMGLKLMVTNAVLIPRFETEELSALAIKNIGSGKLKVIDIGTGSGCIPLAIKKYCPNAEIWAIDNSEPALRVAEENARRLNLKIHFIHNDFLDQNKWLALPSEVDLIISNPPYIANDEKHKMDSSALQFEPHMALFAGEDPLVFYKAIATYARRHLTANGKILVEINEFNAGMTKNVFESMSFNNMKLLKDINNKDRIILCEKEASTD